MVATTEGCQWFAADEVDEEPEADPRLEVRLKSAPCARTPADAAHSTGSKLPLEDQKGKTYRGISFKVGWDFDRMRAKLPGELALAVIAGSVVWLAVILWATETDDLSTAIPFGTLLIGSFTLLIDKVNVKKT